MEPKELVGLYEAYQQVYEPQELSEEVEIATEYFYEMGLNENGINILIEELGEKEFVDWVYDIAEEYTLTEARAGGVRVEPVTKTGKSIGSLRGGARTSAIRSRQKEKAARKASETSASAAKPSGMTAALRSQAAKSSIQKQTPTKKETSEPTQTKKGIGSLIGSIVQRAKQDTELLKKSFDTARGVAARRGAEAKATYDAVRARGRSAEQSPQATRARRVATVATGRAAQAAGRTAIKAAGAAGAAVGAGVAARRQGKTGAQIAGRAAGTFARKMTKEEYDYILEHLVNEGYVVSIESAEKIAMNMSEEWREEILDEEVRGAKKGTIRSVIEKGGRSIKYVQSGGDIVAGDKAAAARASAADRVRSGRNRANAARAEQERKKSIERLNSKPGEDKGDYDSGHYGDDDTSDGTRHYSLSHTNRDARRRRASGR